ncbi:methylmalonyl Co-A mutase-associated GTPase MeaB [Rhabdobacter roseus]|uniref:LAO/AO transport system kinase n=1 Tax=Rhabdobacter roseus TaxID=1655419 RepID=A0A840TR56_9BACT|nr:methylmalonyl Co-A mutase-associated GTPase MeaB [Rhabdobacter roseus]MBB5282520.1 LAO/AO transport system kinase [Rhabdobacter roseus]
MRQRLSVEAYVAGVLAADRVVLSRAITLVESQLPADQPLAQEVLERVLPHAGRSLRLGITGVPGVGKSTFIEAFGKYLTGQGKRLAVLTVDPSSQRSGGSILGDKTRMEELAHDPRAYIRPSAAGTSLGGVARRTREAMLLCEAAGFEIILVETVGVGQSETVVRGMVDFFLLLMLAGAGDELQGIKRGIMEMADAVAITKADGPLAAEARRAQAEYQNALHLFPPAASGWVPQVLTCSALERTGLAELWHLIQKYHQSTLQTGYFEQNRRAQALDWMHDYIRQALEERFRRHPEVLRQLPATEKAVQQGHELPLAAARRLLALFLK